jgi:hypothetical protein
MCLRLCLLAASVLVVAGAVAQDLPSLVPWTEDFETSLSAWRVGDSGKQPLLLVQDRFRGGKQCAYSGPPGNMRVMKRELPTPVMGRLEVAFFDDMASSKQQMAGVTSPGEAQLLGIACRGGSRYQVRIGRDYSEVPVARTPGWHLFAWECDGRRTVAFIDGTQVASVQGMARLAGISLGSFWDASTGWYDDVKLTPQLPPMADPVAQAEEALGTTVPTPPLQVADASGAAGRALNLNVRSSGGPLWVLGAGSDGARRLVVRYQAKEPATRTLVVNGQRTQASFPAARSWACIGLPVEVRQGVNQVVLEGGAGALTLDWLALAPPDIVPEDWGNALTEWLRLGAWRAAAFNVSDVTARGVGISPPAPVLLPADLGPEDSVRNLSKQSQTQLSEVMQAVLDRERPLLASRYRARTATPLGPETALSREVYARLQRYVCMTDPQLRDWPYWPGCRYHKVDYHSEHSVRQNATVSLCYATLLLGPYDPSVASVPREKLVADLRALLRYLAITHRANFLPTGDNSPWGDEWQSAHWAAFAGHAAWLAWDLLDEDTRIMVARMVIHEANRFNTRPPDSGVKNDTKAEENGWNSQIIALAACMFPDHPNASLWRERAIVYMINSYVREADRTLARIVDGRPAADRISAATLWPDYTLENHGRVHPDYMHCIGLQLRNALLYWSAGEPLPESLLFNVAETWAVVKRLTALNGSSFYVNGQDWWPHRHDTLMTNPAFMSVLCKDPDGALIERQVLDFTARMHARFSDGRMWDRREFNYPNAEEEVMCRYAELYQLHRMAGDGEPPAARADFLARHRGVTVFDAGGFVVNRTPESLCSFAWVNGAMGLVFASDDTWFTSPSERGMVGRITCAGLADTTPTVEKRRLDTTADRFCLTMRMGRSGGKLQQDVAVFSLPDGPVIYLERLLAREAVDVREVATATAPILNEDAPGINPNHRTVRFAGGTEEIVGASDKPARLLQWPGAWARVDDRLAVATTGALAYRDENQYRRSRLEEELIANYRANVGPVAAGSVFSRCATVYLPNPAAEAPLALELVPGPEGTLLARWNGRLFAANFTDETQSVPTPAGPVALEPFEARGL